MALCNYIRVHGPMYRYPYRYHIPPFSPHYLRIRGHTIDRHRIACQRPRKQYQRAAFHHGLPTAWPLSPTTSMMATSVCSSAFRSGTRAGARTFGRMSNIATPFKLIGFRPFSQSSRWQIHTNEMTEEQLNSLKVNQGRLMEDIHYTAQWGTGPKWGE